MKRAPEGLSHFKITPPKASSFFAPRGAMCLALSARRPFGPARFARGLDNRDHHYNPPQNNRKDARLPVQLQRAMAAEAEAAREARAKVAMGIRILMVMVMIVMVMVRMVGMVRRVRMVRMVMVVAL